MWDITEKKNPCPACCKGGPGNAWFDLVAKDARTLYAADVFVWRCRNCLHEVPAEGIEHDDANRGHVWAKVVDDDGTLL